MRAVGSSTVQGCPGASDCGALQGRQRRATRRGICPAGQLEIASRDPVHLSAIDRVETTLPKGHIPFAGSPWLAHLQFSDISSRGGVDSSIWCWGLCVKSVVAGWRPAERTGQEYVWPGREQQSGHRTSLLKRCWCWDRSAEAYRRSDPATAAVRPRTCCSRRATCRRWEECDGDAALAQNLRESRIIQGVGSGWGDLTPSPHRFIESGRSRMLTR